VAPAKFADRVKVAICQAGVFRNLIDARIGFGAKDPFDHW
jgi:hypothetical protein